MPTLNITLWTRLISIPDTQDEETNKIPYGNSSYLGLPQCESPVPVLSFSAGVGDESWGCMIECNAGGRGEAKQKRGRKFLVLFFENLRVISCFNYYPLDHI